MSAPRRSAPEKSAPLRLAPTNFELRRSVRTSRASDSLLCEKSAPDANEPESLARAMSARTSTVELMSAGPGSNPMTFNSPSLPLFAIAPSRRSTSTMTASCIRAPRRLAPRRSVRYRWLFVRLAPRRSAPNRSAWSSTVSIIRASRRMAPDRCAPVRFRAGEIQAGKIEEGHVSAGAVGSALHKSFVALADTIQLLLSQLDLGLALFFNGHALSE